MMMRMDPEDSVCNVPNSSGNRISMTGSPTLRWWSVIMCALQHNVSLAWCNVPVCSSLSVCHSYLHVVTMH